MPPPFQQLDLNEFDRLLGRFPFERTVDAIHLHHTWRPDVGGWQGYRSVRLLWSVDTLHRGWSDIAQHLTIAPNGVLWTGRSWNRPPCSSRKANGSRQQGPFMITVVGNFNAGGDAFAAVKERTIDVILRLQTALKIPPDALRFHRDLEPAAQLDCPGRSLERDALLADIEERRRQGASGSMAVRRDEPFPPFGEDAEAWYEFITISNGASAALTDEPDDVPGVVLHWTVGEKP